MRWEWEKKRTPPPKHVSSLRESDINLMNITVANKPRSRIFKVKQRDVPGARWVVGGGRYAESKSELTKPQCQKKSKRVMGKLDRNLTVEYKTNTTVLAHTLYGSNSKNDTRGDRKTSFDRRGEREKENVRGREEDHTDEVRPTVRCSLFVVYRFRDIEKENMGGWGGRIKKNQN